MRYQKKVKNENMLTSSVYLTKGQREFLAKNRINLSAFVRDKVEELIQQHNLSELEVFKKAE